MEVLGLGGGPSLVIVGGGSSLGLGGGGLWDWSEVFLNWALSSFVLSQQICGCPGSRTNLFRFPLRFLAILIHNSCPCYVFREHFRGKEHTCLKSNNPLLGASSLARMDGVKGADEHKILTH